MVGEEMIKDLGNGTTLITLGEGTVFSGLARADGYETPVGICFTNKKVINQKADNAVVFQITNEKAVASYLMAIFRLLETWDEDKTSNFSKTIHDLKKDLEPMLPKERSNENEG